MVLGERPKRCAAGAAVKPHDLELRKYVAATRDNTTDVDEHVQVLIADVAQMTSFGALGQPPDAHEDFLGDAVAERGEDEMQGEGGGGGDW